MTKRFVKRGACVEVLTFEEFVEYGKTQVPAEHLVNGMPWSFEYKGRHVTHENDDTYLLPSPFATPGLGHSLKFNRGELLVLDGVVFYTMRPELFHHMYEGVTLG